MTLLPFGSAPTPLATTSVKGKASFSATNFTVTSGAVDTIQGISSSATPSFAGLNSTGQIDIFTTAANMLTIGRSGGYTSITPTMTSDSAPSPYAAIFSTEVNSGNLAYQAFDKVISNRWLASTSTGYVGLDFGSALWALTKYTVETPNIAEPTRAPKAWTFEGSQTGAWAGEQVVLDTQTNQTAWANPETRTYTFTNTVRYRYYRINITANNGDSLVGMAELDFFVGELFNMAVLSTEIDTYGPVYMKNAAGTAILSLDTVTPLLTIAADLTMSSTTETSIVSKSAAGLVLRNDAASGTFGIVELIIENIGGANGAEFFQHNNSGAEVVDFLFSCYNPGTTTKASRNVRYENRPGDCFIAAPEFQFGTPGSPSFCVADSQALSRVDLKMLDGKNIVLDTTNGTKVGTGITQKLGFWNATPIAQPTTGVAAATFVQSIGTAINDASTFDGYTLGKVVKALRNVGILA